MMRCVTCLLLAEFAGALVSPKVGLGRRLPRLQAKEAEAMFENLVGLFSQGSKSEPLVEKRSIVSSYFAAWNRRDMEAAVACFAEDCEYDDAQYSEPFEGKEKLRNHLLRVAKKLPTNFQFVLDDIADGGSKVGVKWHVEADGKSLPFTRGASFYEIGPEGLIIKGFDVPEPAPFKGGDAGLSLLSFASKLIDEPVRGVPLTVFFLYCWQLFFAENMLLPGPSALQLDLDTWIEVRDLSLNFWFIGPLAMPSLFPSSVHPVLEGVFNLVLAWSALFACFAADGRTAKTNEDSNGFLKTCVGMQFLTNAFYLPYLATRDAEEEDTFDSKDLGPIEKVLETNKSIPILFGVVGIGSIAWALLARADLWGLDLSSRLSTFQDAIKDDRLGSSFLVDLSLYALFQPWLVPDDLKRRRVKDADKTKYQALACIPFLGLVAYLALRPPLRVDSSESD